MRQWAYVLVCGIALALLFAGATIVSAQPHLTQQFVSGGYIQGYVYGFDMYDQLIPLDWVPVTASDGQYSYTAYTANGSYEMFLPAGIYNVTAVEPGYKNYTMTVTVSNGSQIQGVNFYLEQSRIPIPEFPTESLSVMLVSALALVTLVRRAKYRKRN